MAVKKKYIKNGITINDIVDEISYVKEFPKTYTLRDKSKPKIDLLGARSFRIYDSLLIVPKVGGKKLLSFYSLPSYKKLGAFVDQGRGPFELAHVPNFVHATSFRTEAQNRFVYVFGNINGRLIKLNIDKSIATSRPSLSVFMDSLPNPVFTCFPIDSTRVFMREIENNMTQQNRYILKNNIKTTTALLDKLNQISIQKDEDFNVLTSIIKYNPNNLRFVEKPIGMNYLLIYSLDGSFLKVVCLGDELWTVNKVQQKSRRNRTRQFKDLRSFGGFFGVVYTKGAKVYREFNFKDLQSSILFLDWKTFS